MRGSVGSSYGIFDTQIEANRLYDTDISIIKSDYSLARNSDDKQEGIDSDCPVFASDAFVRLYW